MLLSALLKISLSVSQNKRRALKPHGLYWSALKNLVPAVWGRKTFPCGLFIPILAIALSVQALLLCSSPSVWYHGKHYALCTAWTLSSIWWRTIKLLKRYVYSIKYFQKIYGKLSVYVEDKLHLLGSCKTPCWWKALNCLSGKQSSDFRDFYRINIVVIASNVNSLLGGETSLQNYHYRIPCCRIACASQEGCILLRDSTTDSL